MSTMFSNALVPILLASFGHVHALCEQACERLSLALPTLTSSGPAASTPLWSRFQARAQPLCRIEPENSAHVAEILSIIRQYGCHFAILGGGTSPFRGASNADRGITISMRRMRNIAFVNEAGSELGVGAGSVWADIYRFLGPLNMSATGTRNSLTGVVGSILGGGISFFSEYHGWACDTVVEFEVVLANSTVVQANSNTNPDLFWALKGGGNNFGIVTNVVIEVFRGPPEWYSFQLFSMDDLATVFDRLEKHTSSMPQHVWQIATTLQWHVRSNKFVISERMVAMEPPDLPENVPRMIREGKWQDFPVLQTDAYQRSILAMAQKMDGMNAEGFFNFFGSVTVKSDAKISMALAGLFQEEVESIKGELDLQVYIVYNPLTLNALRRMKQRGGNALGLTEDEGPLTVVNINMHWSDERSEARMRHFMRRLIKRFRESAETMSMLHPYIFQNHAFEEQDVFAGSGEGKLARLRAIRQAVDLEGVFQTLQPGYFKLEAQQLRTSLEKSEL